MVASGTMPDENFNEERLEESEYSRKSEFSKPIIIQSQVSRCLELRSRDMRPGYTTFIKEKPVIIPDSRKEFIGSVECLKNALSPEINIHMPNLNEEWETAKKEVFDEFAYHEKTGKMLKNEKAVWVYSNRKYLPQKGASVMCHNDKPKSVGFIYAPMWDDKIDAYWDKMVENADELFSELNKLIHKMDYFKAGTSL